jgi:hypothetical protein
VGIRSSLVATNLVLNNGKALEAEILDTTTVEDENMRRTQAAM